MKNRKKVPTYAAIGRPASSAAANCIVVAMRALLNPINAYAARYAAGRNGPTMSGFIPGA
jgi:hypothetical protein